MILSPVVLRLTWEALQETLVMVGLATLLAELGGLPLGILLVVTEPGRILASPRLNQAVGALVNVGRSIPFIILMVAIIPFTRWVVGTSIGTAAAMVPLTVAAIPYVARLVESSLKEVDPGVVEAVVAMGASPWQVIRKVYLPEAVPSLILGATITAITLVGYSAMAGAVGGGGLGDLAIRYGYQRFRTDVMLVTVLVLVVLVQGIQLLGNRWARRLDRR
ncbi:methionine ABC transporter permease [Limnochorda pilosa]|uniref:Methionine ABC transporter permease n=1 Tax=Limnochorda pilosa TaxID=1555112 RepID=A0A0K2SQ16_LIMPI|nr:methionine ABC transporter permease [Limnochorda pilosa]BAS29213.1 methionine ABC transporter permease [Limnochorda pilosa]